MGLGVFSHGPLIIDAQLRLADRSTDRFVALFQRLTQLGSLVVCVHTCVCACMHACVHARHRAKAYPVRCKCREFRNSPGQSRTAVRQASRCFDRARVSFAFGELVTQQDCHHPPHLHLTSKAEIDDTGAYGLSYSSSF